MTTVIARPGWRGLRATPVLAACVAAAGAALGSGVLSVPCWFHAATGLDCPFCGGSRALGAVMHGDVVGALRWNAFAVLVVLPLVAGLLVGLARKEAGYSARMWLAGRAGLAAAAGLAALTAAWWLLRDLPVAPWDSLRV